MKDVMTLTQLADHLEIDRHTLWDWLRAGRLKAETIGRMYVFDDAAISVAKQLCETLCRPERARKDWPEGVGPASHFIGITAAAAAIGISERTLHRWMAQGRASGFRRDGRVVLMAAEVDAIICQRKPGSCGLDHVSGSRADANANQFESLQNPLHPPPPRRSERG